MRELMNTDLRTVEAPLRANRKLMSTDANRPYHVLTAGD
jgi:hypothetical protein